jgi:hypothetical protein
MALSVQPLMMWVSFLSSLFFENTVSEALNTVSQDQPFFMLALVTAFLPALFEEITFRGAIAHQTAGFGLKRAAILSGLYFAIGHMNLQQFPYAFILGIFMYVLLYYTKSIYAPMLTHFIINLSQISISYFVTGLFNNVTSDANTVTLSSIYIGIVLLSILVLITAIFIIFLIKFIRLNKTNIKAGIYEGGLRVISPSFILLLCLYCLIMLLVN